MEDIQSSVTIRPKANKIQVSWDVRIYYKKKENNKYSCYIPSFNLYYSASDMEVAREKSKAFIEMFFDHFFEFTQRNLTINKLAIELHKLGFKTSNDAHVLSQLIKNILIPAKFSSLYKNLPTGYSNTESINEESKLEVAV